MTQPQDQGQRPSASTAEPVKITAGTAVGAAAGPTMIMTMDGGAAHPPPNLPKDGLAAARAAAGGAPRGSKRSKGSKKGYHTYFPTMELTLEPT